MPKNRSAYRAGILMVVSVALVVAIVVGIKGLSWLSEHTKTYFVAFDLKTNIGGLRIGDEVRIGGFKVGEVKHIAIRKAENPSQPPYYILIAFSVPEKYNIREDAKIRIDGTLTGTSWLNFEDIGKGNPLKDKEPLMGGPSSTSELLAKVAGMAPEVQGLLADIRTKTLPQINDTLADVHTKTVPLVNTTLDKFGQTADSFKKTGENATALTADMRASYKPVIERYNAVADKAVAMMEAIRALFGDTTPDFRTTIANLRQSTDAVKAKLPGIMEKVDGILVKVDTAVDGVNKTMVDVQATMSSAKDLAAGAKAVVVGNKSKLDTMIASLKTTGDNLKAATAEIRRSPWRLLYKPAPNEMSNLNLYDAAREFAEGANQLNETAGALRDAIKSTQASPEELKKLMEQVDKSFGNFKEVEQKLYSNVKD
jgi:phospholipid/cholesterol/gamma-HCH transport system substrate-binding protein